MHAPTTHPRTQDVDKLPTHSLYSKCLIMDHGRKLDLIQSPNVPLNIDFNLPRLKTTECMWGECVGVHRAHTHNVDTYIYMCTCRKDMQRWCTHVHGNAGRKYLVMRKHTHKCQFYTQYAHSICLLPITVTYWLYHLFLEYTLHTR